MSDAMGDRGAMNATPRAGKGGCTGTSTRTGRPCGAQAIAGTDRCVRHAGISPAKHKAKGAVVTELRKWGLGDSTVDPGEVLLRLVTQSAARVELYSRLLEEAYEAADRLRQEHEAGRLLVEEPVREWSDDDKPIPEKASTQTARADLQRIFNTGGIGALIGHQYASTKDGDIFATGEAIRGLAQLEADERDRCANFAAKAVAAGLAERQVRLAERQGALLAEVIRAILGDLGLSPEQQALVPQIVPARLRELTGGAA